MSGICAFFGHRDVIVTAELESRLEETITALIERGINEFWCCEQGNFDWITRLVLKKIKEQYPYIFLCYVSAYNPDKYSKVRQNYLAENYELIYTDEIADGPQKFAIARRNKYIAENANVIVCYIEHNSGGAYSAVKIAKAHNKEIINLFA